MRCTVVVPTYNRAQLLALTLQSLVRQDIPTADFEVIVVDDGSSDETAETVLTYRDRLNLKYFFQDDCGYRVAKARNKGITEARAPICVMIDAGVLLASWAIRAHCEMHESTNDPLAVVGYVYGFNEDNEDAEIIKSESDVTDVDGTLLRFEAERKHLDLREEFYAKYGDDFNYLPAPWVVHWCCNVSAKKSSLMEAGLFDEHFNTWGGEDVELAYRLHKSGCRFILARSAASLHHPHEKSYEHNMKDARTSYLYFAAKHGTPITALVVDNHFWVINDIIKDRALPSCSEYLRDQMRHSA